MWPFRSKSLREHLSSGKKVKVEGIVFYIRKINVLDYLDGSRVMAELFSVYKTKDEKTFLEKSSVENFSKLKKYLTDIILAGVIAPKLVRDKTDTSGLFIDDLFSDWLLAQKLAETILAYTYGKKK